jgi:hypothetical protein
MEEEISQWIVFHTAELMMPLLPEFELAANALPEGFDYPEDYYRLIATGLTTFVPWQLLAAAPAASWQSALRSAYPTRQLVPFAARTDRDAVACWAGTSRRVAVLPAHPDDSHDQQQIFVDIYAWLRAAMDDFLAASASQLPEQTPPLLPGFALPASELPAGFAYPALFAQVLTTGLRRLEPWSFFENGAAHRVWPALHVAHPNRQLVPFASHTDRDAVACWDGTQPDVYVLPMRAGPASTPIVAYPDLAAWLLAALDEFISQGYEWVRAYYLRKQREGSRR